MKHNLFRNFFFQSISCLLFLANTVQAQNIPTDNTYPSSNSTISPFFQGAYPSGQLLNYLRTTVTTTPVTAAGVDPNDKTKTRVSTQYLDGLGRSLQKVDHYASPLGNDMINFVLYDNLGRDALHFLPYSQSEPTAADHGKFELGAVQRERSFYFVEANTHPSENFFYSKNNYEASPLNRVTKVMPQGNNWIGNDRGQTIVETTLPAGANIRYFTCGYDPSYVNINANDVYAAGELLVKTITDEDGNFTEEYTNKNNQVVLRTTGKTGNSVKLQTYYVYDDFGLLRYTIPPKAVVWLAANNWWMSAAVQKDLCFTYEYDGRSRLIHKIIPGSGDEWMVYNQKDELVFLKNNTLTNQAAWIFYKYDVLGRMIQTGNYYDSHFNYSQASLQSLANNYTGIDPFMVYMFKDVYGYSNYINTFQYAQVYTTNYYDDYSFVTSPLSNTYNASYMSSLPAGWNNTVTTETNNMLTGTRTLLLDKAPTPTELVTVNYYNDRGRLLQTQEKNFKGGWNYTTYSYNFVGDKLGAYTEINNPGAADNANIKTIETYTYDHAGRALTTTHQLNNLPAKVSSSITYDEIGRVKQKTLDDAGNLPLEYSYNIRGWLRGINRNYCLNSNDAQPFGMELSYDYGYTTNYLNGTLAGIKWRNKGHSTELRSYGYRYDTYNRLAAGDFVLKTGTFTGSGSWSNATKDFTASNMTYDPNGNLLTMKQMGQNMVGTKIILDDLTYTYVDNTNKLMTVVESASSQSKDANVQDLLGDFKYKSGAYFSYWNSGNLGYDYNRSLSFNYEPLVNKPNEVDNMNSNEFARYLYDGNGNKLRKTTGSGVTILSTTEYIGAAVYVNNSLSFISQPEGRIRYKASSPTPYMYDYFIKDHLGSTRAVVTYTNGNIEGFAPSDEEAANNVIYKATSEPDNASKENQLFDNIDKTRAINPERKTEDDKYVARLSAKDGKDAIGPDITIKVMSGDKVKISAEALIVREPKNSSVIAQSVVENVVSVFTTAPTLATEGISTMSNTSFKNVASNIATMEETNGQSGAPKAYLNYVLYDEFMHLIATGSGVIPVKNKEGWQVLETDNIEIPQNGFLRVFTNNKETAPVSINNTTLTVNPSQLVEEYNYYPYGLLFHEENPSQSPNITKTNYLYSGKELQHNEFSNGQGIELDDYGARWYDARIGRWAGVDPSAEYTYNESPYCYVGNNPVSRMDPDGNTWWDIVSGVGTAIADNMYPGLNTSGSYNAVNNSDFNIGNKIGQAASILIGAGEAIVGGGAAGIGGASTVLSAGVTSPVSVPVAIGGAALLTHGANMMARGAANFMTGKGEKPETPVEKSPATEPYKRPNNATTPAQRKSVQGKPCVDCGKVDGLKVADHKEELVVEYYRTGTIDKTKMRALESVQPQCQGCSAKQGAEMSKFSKEQKKLLTNGQ
jgi:RHS repeat-associated protein